MLKGWIEGLSKVADVAPWLFLAIGLSGLTVLLFPISLAETFGVAGIREDHRTWIGVATIAGLVIWVTYVLGLASKRGVGWFSRRKARGQLLARLAAGDFEQEEYRLLAYYMWRRGRTQYLPLHYPPARSLASKGVLRPISGQGSMMAWPYVVPEYVWDFLQKHKEQLFPELDKPEVQSAMERFPGHMRDFNLFGHTY